MFSLRKSMVTSAVRYGRWRSFLTDAYRCEDVWQQRLSCPLLKKVDHETMYSKLSNLFDNHAKQISAVDLDVFANSLTDATYLDELDDLTHKFRLSSQAMTLLPSTHHAVVRIFLETNKVEDLMRILKDRLNYGIFPDYYLNNLLMDKFLKENNFRDAAKIAANQMLQEEFDNEITKSLALYSCVKYITNPTDWGEVDDVVTEDQKESDDEEEDTRVRVGFLRNPYFDGHFDLKEADQLIGKTLVALSKNSNVTIGNSIKVIGLAYYNQWDKLIDFLITLDSAVFPETVQLGLATVDKYKPGNAEHLTTAFNKLKLDTSSLVLEAENAVKESVDANEEKEIQLQQKIYKDWETFRPEELNRHLDRQNKMKRLQKIQQIKQDLQEKEQVLFFFDEESKYDLIKEEKMKRMKKKVERKNPKEDITYIPPEIRQPGFKRE
ncbi:uncharacterized protein LOC126843437 [Adelges cooleyi]|uniref:uncharacterized protein LOC126843437 n=1 Tax=Adelges cooleyi TaxID=133065 RepID=UPI00217F4DB4|nr:uncharacterized protein LOC126843437 [Adelges cooleyi]